jgi:hypothetical protein
MDWQSLAGFEGRFWLVWKEASEILFNPRL